MAFILKFDKRPQKCLQCPLGLLVKSDEYTDEGVLRCNWNGKEISRDEEYFASLNPYFQDIEPPEWCPIIETTFRNI